MKVSQINGYMSKISSLSKSTDMFTWEKEIFMGSLLLDKEVKEGNDCCKKEKWPLPGMSQLIGCGT